MHKPVLLEQILSLLQDKKLLRVIDGTFGYGGHSEALLRSHSEIEKVFAIDQDKESLSLAQSRLAEFDSKIAYIHDSFRHMKSHCALADLVLLDIGVSSMQLDQAARGFSFSKEGPLDMRMNKEQQLDAKEVIHRYSEKELARILFEYGEVRGSRRLAHALVEARKKRRFETTKELVDFMTPLMGYHPKKIHPMTLVFQALRIEVNDELAALEEGLESAFELLAPKGILCVISFHSLEDRIVKCFFRDKAHQKQANLLTKKPLQADDAELKANPRARSAKLRLLEKL